MRTVCFVIQRLGVGGAEQMVVSEVQELLRRGFAVHLVTLNPEKKHSLMPSISDACQRELVLFHALLDWRALRTLSRRFRELNPDIIITQLWFANSVARIAARAARMHHRVLAFEQNVYDQTKSWKQFLLDRLLQGWCKDVVAITRSVRDSLLRHGIREKRIVVIHNAIEIARFADASPAAIRQELGIGNEFIYLFVGRLMPQKGVDVLLDAFARQQSGVLIIAGNGEERAQLEARSAALGISARVHFLGIRHDVPALMKASDCLVLASRWEGFGIALVEAMACGLPVVATNVDGIKEVVDDGVSGILVPPENPTAFAEALLRVREDTALAASIRKNGMERARTFSIQQHIENVLSRFPGKC